LAPLARWWQRQGRDERQRTVRQRTRLCAKARARDANEGGHGGFGGGSKIPYISKPKKA